MNRPEPGEHHAGRLVRSASSLVVIAVCLGLALGAALGVVVWLIATGLHHASTG